MVIRRFERPDAIKLAELSKEVAKELDGWESKSGKYFLRLSNKDKDMVWVAEYKGSIVGYLLGDKVCLVNILGEKRSGIELAVVFVQKIFRGKGIGMKLIQKFENEMKKRGEPRIFCYANGKTVNSVLKSLGYKKTCNFVQKEL